MSLPRRCPTAPQPTVELWPEQKPVCRQGLGAPASLPCTTRPQPQPTLPTPVSCPTERTATSLPRQYPTGVQPLPRDAFWLEAQPQARTAPCNGTGPQPCPARPPPTPLWPYQLATPTPPSQASVGLPQAGFSRVGAILAAQTPAPIDCNPPDKRIVHPLPDVPTRTGRQNPPLNTCCPRLPPPLQTLPAPTF